MTNFVEVKNLVNFRVGINVPEIRLIRPIAPNSTVKIKRDDFEMALTYPGVMQLFDKGYLAVVNQDDRIEFNMQEPETEVDPVDLAGEKEIRDILISGTPFRIKKLCANASADRKEVIAQIAFSIPELTIDKMNILTEATGVDIMKGAAALRELQKED